MLAFHVRDYILYNTLPFSKGLIIAFFSLFFGHVISRTQSAKKTYNRTYTKLLNS